MVMVKKLLAEILFLVTTFIFGALVIQFAHAETLDQLIAAAKKEPELFLSLGRPALAAREVWRRSKRGSTNALA